MGIFGIPGLIDLFFLIILLRITYIAASRGFLREFCKIAGLFCASFLAFSFYLPLSEAIGARISFVDSKYLYPSAFIAIFIATGIVFSLINLILGLLLPRGESSIKKKIVLIGAGLFRAVFLFSVLFFIFNLFSFYPEPIGKSLSYNLTRRVAPALYLFSAQNASRFNQDIEINKEVEIYLKEDQGH